MPNKQGGLIKGEGGRSLKKIKGEGLIKGEGGRSQNINKRGGSNKRGGWQIIENEYKVRMK